MLKEMHYIYLTTLFSLLVLSSTFQCAHRKEKDPVLQLVSQSHLAQSQTAPCPLSYTFSNVLSALVKFIFSLSFEEVL